MQGRLLLNTEHEVMATLDEALSLQGRGAQFKLETLLHGSLPEFDSMPVITVVTSATYRAAATAKGGLARRPGKTT